MEDITLTIVATVLALFLLGPFVVRQLMGWTDE